MSAQELQKLEPAMVWRFFGEIAAVPRPSKKEGRIRDRVRQLAHENGLRVREDRVGNMVIEVAASPGRELMPVTVLQGHLDMVCEKNADTAHDFERDPIQVMVEKDPDGEPIVRAAGTTLGADNGIGVAMALAVACADNVVHGPLELLFTVDEETGMTGAQGLEPRFLRGRRLLNLDSEEDDKLYIGCAGGCDAVLSWQLPVKPIAEGMEVCRVTVSGLRGGHSGGDIHLNRGNAIKLLTRALLRVNTDSLQTAAEQVRGEGLRESSEEKLVIRVEAASAGEASAALAPTDTHRVLSALAALPHGVLGMQAKMEGLVETSNNVATVSFALDAQGNRAQVEVATLSRSSSGSRLNEVLAQITAVGRLAGAAVRTGNAYPGWEPNPDSPTLTTCRTVYEKLFGEPPKVTAIHAGLECGIIGERVGGADTVSFGPRIVGAHSPDERVYVASVAKSWRFLTAVLAELAGS
jgi:dipeptidase D